jgi:small subunit ribosomal protein S10
MAKKKVEEEKKSKLRIKLRAYDHRVIDKCAREIIEVLQRYGAETAGPIPLPTEIHKFTVNRASFVHKDSREQFEIRIHKRIIDVFNPTQKIIEGLQNLSLPTGVDVEIKM